jgi:murein DD-endopeptidase MepM/ murein hydrolase activator NlpD
MITDKKRSPRKFAFCSLILPAAAIMLMFFSMKNNASERQIRHSRKITVRNTPDIAPLDFKKVTKVVLYGDITDPTTNQTRNHTGIDFQIDAGSEVVATADGIVIDQKYNSRRGNYILIKHDDTYSTQYSHLQTALVKEGERVTKGQTIGLAGKSGVSATSPHLHYEILKNGIMVNPKAYLPALPVHN